MAPVTTMHVRFISQPVRATLCRFRSLLAKAISNQFLFAINCKLSLALVGFGAVITVACVMYADHATRQLLQVEAERAAEHWAHQFIANIPTIEEIANGRSLTAAERNAIKTFAGIGSIYKFKLFDRTGNLRLTSDGKRTLHVSEYDFVTHSEQADRVLRTRRAAVTFIHSTGRDNLPTFYSQAHVPIVNKGQVVGAVELYIDQAEMHASYQARANQLIVVSGLLSAFLFGFPAFAFYVKSEQASKASQKLLHLTNHDPLTGVGNRKAFNEKIDTAVATASAGQRVALFCLDLDHFKAVNDNLGHDVGDKLLESVAQRLRECVRSRDFIARLGGDEFVVIQFDVDSENACEALATRITRAFHEPFHINGHRLPVGLSIGLAIAPTDGGTVDQLFKSADIALYRAKQEGRGTFRFFEVHMDQALQQRRKLELDLCNAIANDQFVLYFQPQVDMACNEIVGYEALLRWRHPQNGLIPPLDFIPIAEETGLIKDIGRWVLIQACADAAAWPRDLRVAVNLSAVQLLSPSIVDDVSHALIDAGLEPHRLELEVTETVLIQDAENALKRLAELKRLGVKISMDDFGTGYSSLSYLQKFPFDTVKIDKCFIDGVEASTDSRAIVRAIVGLSHNLGKQTTAEGVETYAQAALLRADGCDQIQGYLVSRPMPAHQVVEFFETYGHNPRTIVAPSIAVS